MNLSTLIDKKYKDGSLKQFFTKKGYKIKEFKESPELTIIVIDYIEKSVGSFKSIWAKEARGRAYAWFKDKFYTLKVNLIKGFELPNLNFDKSNSDNNYIEIAQKFATGGLLHESYLSEKIDGCLIVVSVYTKNTIEYQIMMLILKSAWYVETEDLLFVPSSRSTLVLTSNMQQYFLKSFSGYSTANIEYGWKQYKDVFLKLVLNIYNKCAPTEYQLLGLIFEAVCKNRGYKTELTVSYDSDQFLYLGYCNENIFVPHYKTDQSISQPSWYKVHSVAEVKDILTSLEANLTYKGKIYPEGFVYLDHFNCNITPFYCKLKPSLYYRCHKLKHDDIINLIKTSSQYDNIYPLIKELKFISSNQLETNLVLYQARVFEYIKPYLNYNIKGDPVKALFANCKNLNFSFFPEYFPINLTNKDIFSFSRLSAIHTDVSDLRKFLCKHIPAINS